MIMGFKIAGVNVWGVCCLYGGEQHGDKQGQCGCFLSCLHGSERLSVYLDWENRFLAACTAVN